MDLEKAKLIQDVVLFRENSVSKETGKDTLKSLEDEGVIEPKHTPTGRTFLSICDSRMFVDALLTRRAKA